MYATRALAGPPPSGQEVRNSSRGKVLVSCRLSLRIFNYRKIAGGMEKAMAPHSSALAWKIPWTEEPGRLQSMGLLRVGHD